jgi:hypothetical protein
MPDSLPYSLVDRALHKVSFGSNMLQDILGDIEDNMFNAQWKNISAENPIFITSLPRAGTTIVLESLYRIPGLATHTYRDMPFIYTPVLWDKLSGKIRNSGTFRERAHGDGLVVSEDSPEAFEEVLWRKYFANNYDENHIKLWSTTKPDFSAYFRLHMKKIISLRCAGKSEGRYVSKNNGNIARTSAINSMFPDAFIITPFRDPIEQAISLWKQHRNFLQQHRENHFVKKYMADIGHYEFGLLHRPIEFPEFESLSQSLGVGSPDYWLAYWIAAFEYLSKQKGLAFLSYESLCSDPKQGIETLCRHLNLRLDEFSLLNSASVFNSPPPPRKQEISLDPVLAAQASDLYGRLLSKCLLR